MSKVKVILVGESCAGKTAIIEQYINQIFKENNYITVGCDKFIKEININGNRLNLEICDLPGGKKYRRATIILMKNTDIALLFYDITDRRSFEELNYWIENI